jgi:hypothetical protein
MLFCMAEAAVATETARTVLEGSYWALLCNQTAGVVAA